VHFLYFVRDLGFSPLHKKFESELSLSGFLVVLAAMGTRRILIIVAGVKKPYWSFIQDAIGDLRSIDCREYLPSDPQAKGKATIDAVTADRKGFRACVHAICDAALAHGSIVVCCNHGIHRSTVSAAVAKQRLEIYSNVDVVASINTPCVGRLRI
jgi:hypothetical protein